MTDMCIEKPPTETGGVVRDILLDLTCALRCEARVLITGDSAGGKRELAGMIHYGSRRALGRFEVVDCAALSDAALEAELFGRDSEANGTSERATTGLLELADGGTVLLDNIGEMGSALQTRLLEFLEDGRIQRVGADHPHTSVDVRVISSADRDLFARAGTSGFNEDLYYRLNIVHLVLPAAGAGALSQTATMH